MGFQQYYEPPEELPPATGTSARMIISLVEEAEAIDWYEQRISLCVLVSASFILSIINLI